jgi:hypothetical protein
VAVYVRENRLRDLILSSYVTCTENHFSVRLGCQRAFRTNAVIIFNQLDHILIRAFITIAAPSPVASVSRYVSWYSN